MPWGFASLDKACPTQALMCSFFAVCPCHMYSGRYYSNFASLCQQRGKAAAPMCEALVKSRVVPNLGSNSFANTLFFSGAAAFTRAQVQPSSVEPAALARLVKNSIVPGLHAFPDGFVSGNSYPTLLEGARLKIVYEK